MLEILYYADSRGCQPVLDWIREMKKYEPVVYRKFYQLQIMLRENGKLIQQGKIKRDDIKKLKGTNDIWQLRIRDDRVLFFYYAGDAIVFTNQFRKKQNSTPHSEIERAENRKEEHEAKINLNPIQSKG
ncbi:type II toxin-antitoxin system RelE/ParE family toxin [Priestia megaterium]|uniref:type II toxin-antitoxin system RelE/ParE family toxin n=1 Tax=Priestia megaterium TaxID=1404 RepID=UPI0015D4D41D|nr:type II toxin-antitoxin system RelE/ParE family toxin [Priestia megaterium]